MNNNNLPPEVLEAGLLWVKNNALALYGAAASFGMATLLTLRDGRSWLDALYAGASGITVGDKREGTTGRLNFSLSSQYDDAAELLLFTPMLKADNTNLFDFEIESAAGLAQRAEKLFLSAMTDGCNYGHEQLIKSDDTYRHDARGLLRRVGRCRKNIGFRIRLITKTPTSLAL